MIRKAKIYEVEQLRSLAKQVYCKENLMFALDRKFMFPRYVKNGNMFVYEHEGRIVGMVNTYKNVIANLWVDDSFQGRRIGSGLLLEAENNIKKQGFSKIILDSEATAVSFYLRKDYNPVSRVRLVKNDL